MAALSHGKTCDGDRSRRARPFGFRRRDGFLFYASYLWYKLVLPFEVRSPRWKMWGYEIVYTAAKFRDYARCLPWNHALDRVVTRFGCFRIRRHTSDAAVVSPAFERRDVNRLLSLIARKLSEGRRVVFLDVGADLGTYAITVGNRFRGKAVRVVAFEPVPASCALLRRNVKANRLGDQVAVHEVALMSGSGANAAIRLDAGDPGSSSLRGSGPAVEVESARLDEVLELAGGDDAVLVMKLDVEGAEKEVLDGAEGLLRSGREVHLMVEDFIDRTIVDFLVQRGWAFAAKRTPYNSWWQCTGARPPAQT
jgi:FkbM family methyltransferase